MIDIEGQTLATIQTNLINIEIALSNKTLSRDTAVKYIKQSLLLAEKITERLKYYDVLKEITETSQMLLEKCHVPYSSLGIER